MSSAKWHTFCLSLNEITCLNLLYPGHLTFVSVVKWVFVVEFYGFHTSIVSDEATSSKVFSFPRTIASCSINDIRGIKAALKCLPRLLNSLCPVAMESQWDMRHGLQLVVVSCIMIGWYKCWWGASNLCWIMARLQCIIGTHDWCKFPPFFKGHGQSPCTAPTAGKWLSLGLCIEAVNKSSACLVHVLGSKAT